MLKLKSVMAGGALCAVLVVALLTSASSKAFADTGDLEKGATQFVEVMADDAVALFGNKTMGLEERQKSFRTLLRRDFDVQTIGQWVLGRYWRQATPEQRQEYLQLFEDLLVQTYVDRFEEYNNEELEVGRAVKVAERDVLVRSNLVSPSGKFEPVGVDWRVREKSGGYKVIDVMVAGVSLGQTQRSEFASVIRSNGGNVEGLLTQLRRE